MKLTLPQQDVYFEQLLYPAEPIYNIGAKIRINGPLDKTTLQAAYIALIDQHDTYRTILVHKGEFVKQLVLTKHGAELAWLDFSKEEQAEEKARNFMQRDFMRPFDLSAEELLHRFILIKTGEQRHYLFSVYHHLITDGWGTSLMFQRLVKNYNEIRTEGSVQSKYTFTYADFAEDDLAYEQSAQYQKDKQYWSDKFAILPEPIFERFNPVADIHKSAREELFLPRALYDQLQTQARSAGGNAFHAILALLFLYIGRRQQQTDLSIGLPVLNRGKAMFKKTVGLFMGVSALRIQLDTAESFGQLVQKIRQQLRQDYRHQRFPLGKLIQELDAFAHKDRIFNISLSYEKQNYADHFAETRTEVLPLSHQSERVALAIYIREFDASEDVKIDFDYNLNYFTKDGISQFTNHFYRLFTEVIEGFNRPLKAYEYLSQDEQRKILQDFNATEVTLPAGKTLLNYFAEQAGRQPDALALTDLKNNYSYAQLNQLSAQVAGHLQEQLGEDNSPVAVLMNRSADLLIVLLGILKSGRAFIPLDPDFPTERLQHIIAHSGVEAIITDAELIDELSTSAQFLAAEYLIKTNLATDSLPAEILPADTAYIIYTSGSTGLPKGVEIGHAALLNFLLSMREKPGMSENDLLYSVTTQSFDISILEFFTPLISGGTVFIADSELLIDPLATMQDIATRQPTVLQGTPSFFQLLFNAGWQGHPYLRIYCGGDLLSPELAKKLIDSCAELWNMYGPTETTIWSSCKQVQYPEEASNIGQPIHNTQLYLLDADLQPLPINCPGTLYIGGQGVAKGYYKNEELTNIKFVENPFRPGEKMYDTGDAGRWTTDGEMLFLGRNDQQVKIRGYRIELGEIETVLQQYPGIAEAVVVAKKNREQEALLLAFIKMRITEGENTQALDRASLKTFLAQKLPQYMVPQVLIELAEFPLTPNKKVNRKALSQYEFKADPEAVHTKRPFNELEEQLSIWFTQLLELKSAVGREDNFFQLGGHSLNAVKLIQLIHEQSGYQLSLKSIFSNPTVKELAEHLQNQKTSMALEIPHLKETEYYAITDAQKSLWLAAQQETLSIAYNMVALFEISGPLNAKNLQTAFLQVLKKFEILRSNFKELEGKVVQKIKPVANMFFELKAHSIAEADRTHFISEFVNREFDLENDVLLRACILKNADRADQLIFATHHIVVDGWSLEILIQEVIANYQSLSAAKSLEITELPFQFKDYAAWQLGQAELESEANRAFWKNYLADYSWPKLTAPMKSENQESAKAGNYRFQLDGKLLDDLSGLARAQQTTLHSVLMSAFQLLQIKTSGLEDLILGTVNAGRGANGLQDQMGMFVQTLPLRTHYDKEASFVEFLKHTHQIILQLDQRRFLPLEIQAQLQLEILCVFQYAQFDFQHIALDQDVQLTYQPIDTDFPRLPLLIIFSMKEEGLEINVRFAEAIYEFEEIQYLFLQFENLLSAIVNAPTQLISEYNLDLESSTALEINFNF